MRLGFRPTGTCTSLALAFVLACLGASLPGEAVAGDLFNVTGVSANDTLNVRAQPSPSAPIIGSLAFDATSVEATGVTRRVGNAMWRQVTMNGRTGWVNDHYLTNAAPAAGRPQLFHTALSCSGTEPFWGLQIEGERGEFDSLAEGKADIRFSTVRAARGVPNIWSFRGQSHPDGKPVFAILEETNMCSDGMSDLTYRYSVRIDFAEGPFYAGCCNPTGAANSP